MHNFLPLSHSQKVPTDFVKHKASISIPPIPVGCKGDLPKRLACNFISLRGISIQEEFVNVQHVVHVHPGAEQATGDLFSVL